MFVRTKASQLKADAEKTFQTVVFEDRKGSASQSSKAQRKQTQEKKISKEQAEKEMKKLRYEVIKFGTTGFVGEKKEESRIALAVALGAKPPKRKNQNYKEILAAKELEKKTAVIRKDQKMPKFFFASGKKSRQNTRFNKKGETKGLLDVYGKVRKSQKPIKEK